MDQRDWLAQRFQTHRPRLQAVAYRMLGSHSEADDAVQEAWLRLDRTGAQGVHNLQGWLTTVVAHVCLDMLRSRTARREHLLDGPMPEPITNRDEPVNPEEEAVVADSIGLALLVVLDTLAPCERVTFVLHDIFAVPYEEIAPIVGRSPSAARQLASRARRRVRNADPATEVDLVRRHAVVDAFLAAARNGDFAALITLLADDVVVRADAQAVPAGTPREVRGAADVARQALSFATRAPYSQPMLVNGAAGIAVIRDGSPVVVLAFTLHDTKITEIEVIANPDRLRGLDLTPLDH